MKTVRTIAAALLASLLALQPASADVYLWSQTPASNTNSDLGDDINLVEGMAPSEVNDSIRAVMAELAKWRDDLGSAKPSSVVMTTAGSANAQTLSTNGAASSLTNGWTLCFVVGGGLTNTSSMTLNVDSLGAKAVQAIDGSALAGGEVAAGTLQCASYQSTDQVWLLHQNKPIDNATLTYTSAGKIQRAAITGDISIPLGSNVASLSGSIISGIDAVPTGTVLDFAGTTCPSRTLPAYGQAISRTTYSELFGIIGTTWGIGDNVTTFNLPDLRGRVVAGEDDMGGVSANRITTTFNGDTFAVAGGEELHTMTTGELVAHTHTQQGSFASGTESANHTHSISLSGTSSGESATHTHGGSGTTSSDGSHSHSYDRVDTSGAYTNGGGTGEPGSNSSTSTGSSGSHSHTYSFTTGGQSVGHTHTWSGSGTSGTVSALHTHTTTISGATASTGSTTPFNNLQPTAVMSKCIYTGV